MSLSLIGSSVAQLPWIMRTGCVLYGTSVIANGQLLKGTGIIAGCFSDTLFNHATSNILGAYDPVNETICYNDEINENHIKSFSIVKEDGYVQYHFKANELGKEMLNKYFEGKPIEFYTEKYGKMYECELS